MEETELVTRAVKGDIAAFGELVDRYMTDVYRLARSMGYPRGDAEDLMQDTFLAAFEGIARYKQRSSFKTWLCAILFRQASRARRYRAIRKTEALDDTLAAGPNGAVKREESRLDAHAMLESLSAEHRAVLVLREMQGMTYDEIAEALDVPRGTVESRLFRARNTLRERYREYGDASRRARRLNSNGGQP